MELGLTKSIAPFRRSLLASAFLTLTTSAVAQRPSTDLISPPDVLALVDVFRAELEELRFLMGRPKNRQPELNVQRASPREVYFQALTMFQKADRMCFEHTRKRSTRPTLPEGDISPSDVYNVVDAALQSLRQVKRRYGLETDARLSEPDATKQPTDVFKSIVQANQQLNLMLERQFAPSDVFQQVTRAVGYASRLLDRFPNTVLIPEEPAFEAGKRPADVYRRLLGCVERIRRLADLSGLELLELQVDEKLIQQAEPSDVFDIASLVVSELSYLHGKLTDAKPPRDVYYVGRKFPAHVYQRVGILERQLAELDRRVQENPDWLTQEPVGE